MGRAPCCEKMGLKKGPWTPEEDQILIRYIQLYGHSNWRALPKQAGLLRCGKSCRLRWTNYLRPDIKRGNFTREEEDTIIQLHQMLGNRWSAIAAKLPGRTDNEIKNVWHTHLKKRVKQTQHHPNIKPSSLSASGSKQDKISIKREKNDRDDGQDQQELVITTVKLDHGHSPQQSNSDDVSTLTTTTTINTTVTSDDDIKLDDSFWSEVLSADHSAMTTDNGFDDQSHLSTFSPPHPVVYFDNSTVPLYDNMDFWFNVFTRAEELTELLDI